MLSIKIQTLLRKSNIYIYLNQNNKQYIYLYRNIYKRLIIKYAKLSINRNNYCFDFYIYKQNTYNILLQQLELVIDLFYY